MSQYKESRKFGCLLWGILIGVILGLFWFSQTAHAQVPCTDSRDGLVKQLTGKYKEKQRAYAILKNGAGILEVFSTDKGSTWTVFVTHPNGRTCVYAAGDELVIVPPEPEGEPS